MAQVSLDKLHRLVQHAHLYRSIDFLGDIFKKHGPALKQYLERAYAHEENDASVSWYEDYISLEQDLFNFMSNQSVWTVPVAIQELFAKFHPPSYLHLLEGGSGYRLDSSYPGYPGPLQRDQLKNLISNVALRDLVRSSKKFPDFNKHIRLTIFKLRRLEQRLGQKLRE